MSDAKIQSQSKFEENTSYLKKHDDQMMEQTEQVYARLEKNSSRLDKLEKDQDLMKLIIDARD